jgi:hypothetical protein
MLSVDAAEGDAAEDSPLKKKSTPSKAKGKALASAAKLEDKSSPVKKEVDEASEDDAWIGANLTRGILNTAQNERVSRAWTRCIVLAILSVLNC